MADSTNDLTYTPTTWADGADGGTAITADRLNNIEQGINNATKQVNANTKGIKVLGDSVSPIHFNTGTPAISKLDFFSWNDESMNIDVYRAETGHKMRISFSSSGVSFDPNPAN